MDYKERYNKLVEAVKVLQKTNPSDEGIQNWINDNVPKLAESEDERIRKAIHIYLDWLDGRKDYAPKGEYSIRDIIAWLEKQGEHSIYNVPPREVILAIWDLGNEWKELTNGCISTEYGTQLNYIQKHWEESGYYLREKQGNWNLTDKVEPKFKVGDTIINIYYRWDGNSRIREITDGKYIFDNGSYINIKEQDNWELVDKNKPKFKAGDWIVFANGNVEHIESVGTHGYTFEDGDYLLHENCDNQAHLWTIQDAKDGDVLVSELSGTIILFKGIEDNNIQFYCDYDLSEIDVPGDRFAVNNSGQHYGSVEDSEDFHPATEEQRDTLFAKMTEAGYEWDADHKELKNIEMTDLVEDYIKQKPAWSEEDEKMLSDAIGAVSAADHYTYDDKCKIESWLKSIKQRLGCGE